MSSTSNEHKLKVTDSQVAELQERILQLECDLAKTSRDLKISEQRNRMLSAHNDALSKLLKSKLK
jgi:hypothetical protein